MSGLVRQCCLDYVASVSSVVLVFHVTAADSEQQPFALHQCLVTD